MTSYVGSDGRTHPPHTSRFIVEAELTPDWRNRAACRSEDPDLFFPIGNTGPALLQTEDAKSVCRRCDSVDRCLQWALETGQDHGVWGAMSEDDRRSLKQRTTRANQRARERARKQAAA